MLLKLDSASDCIGHMVAFRGIAGYYYHHVSVVCGYLQHGSVIFYILIEIFMEQNIIDKSVLKDGNNRLKLLSYKQIVGASLFLLINQCHGIFQSRYHTGSVHGFCHVFDGTELESFLRIIEFIVCGHYNENSIFIALSDLAHCIKSVYTGHLNIHDRNIGMEGLGKFDDLSSCLGMIYYATVSEFFFDDERKGINHYSFVISQ